MRARKRKGEEQRRGKRAHEKGEWGQKIEVRPSRWRLALSEPNTVSANMQDPLPCACEAWAMSSGTQLLVRPKKRPLTDQAEDLSANTRCEQEADR